MNLLQSENFSKIIKKCQSIVLVASILASTSVAALPMVAHAAPILTPTAKVSFTFDDGLASAATDAQPTLSKYGFVGTDYVITQCIGMTTAPNTCHANTSTTYMTWAQVNQLKTAGWEIGSHTQTHPYLASSDATDGQPNVLTPAQVSTELVGAKSDLTSQGINATDFASPYGDWTPPILAQIAKTYASHRGFADNIDQNADGVIDHGNTFPYNDYLLYDYQVQAGVTVAQVESMIDQTKANNQWLVLTFHNIKPVASTNAADYEYNTADLDAIAAYVKASGMPVVTPNDGGLVTNAGNLLPNYSFDTALSTNTADTTSWSTDSTSIAQDTGNNGSYPSSTNSVVFNGTTTDSHLFSPRVAVNPAKTYVLKNYLNVTNIAVAAGHELGFYIDEYDAAGNYLGATARYMRSEVGNAGNPTGAWVEDLNFAYTPTAGAAFARLQIVDTAGSATHAYLDNVQWFAEDGSTTAGVGAGTPVSPVVIPVTTPTTGKVGDLDGDGKVGAHDFSIMLSHWNRAATAAQGDLDGNGIVNAHDLSMLLSNWNK